MTGFQFRPSGIGQITGKLKIDGRVEIAQFLGLKYASIENVFAPSKLVNYSGHEFIDAMRFGPMVLGPQAWNNEFGFIQKELPMPEMTISELDGLNLNVTVPLWNNAIPETKRPVFIFVHGGGFSLGSNAWPQYDQSRIVKLSVDLGLPVIGVGINYRVGLPGFLTSEEMRKSGLTSNNGIRDQVNAFRWVQKHISEFGGDPENITFIGESAGSVSGSLLLHQKEPLFKRYISMSGTSLMLKPLPPPVSEFVYSTIMQNLGLGELSGAERVKALTKIPADKLIEASASGLPLQPVIDGDVIPCAPTFSQIGDRSDQSALAMPGRTWCTDLLIGDCQFDGSILAWMLGKRTVGITKSFINSIGKTLASQPSAAQQLQQAYHISPELEDSVALRNILQFATDIGFFAPVITWAQSWPGNAYAYHFNEVNPWKGEWEGEATHILDVAYLFQNYDEYLTAAQQDVAKAFATDFIKFMNGKQTQQAFTRGTQGATTYGPSGKGNVSQYVDGIASVKSGRKDTIFKLAENFGLEELSAAWGNFLAGK